MTSTPADPGTDTLDLPDFPHPRSSGCPFGL